jgi:hypothetical protein
VPCAAGWSDRRAGCSEHERRSLGWAIAPAAPGRHPASVDAILSSPPHGVRHGRKGAARASGAPPRFDARMSAALTDMHAYALALDAEADRVSVRIRRLGESAAPGELAHLTAERAAIGAEAGLLRSAIDALRRLADPGGRYL